MKTKIFSPEFNEVIIQKVFQRRGNSKNFGNNVERMMGNISELLCVKSNKNVIRGLHFQNSSEISKFITCKDGKILDVF